MSFQVCFTSPLSGKDEKYYNEYLDKTINEINIIFKNEKIKKLYICIYDLIDEFDRVTKELIIQKKRLSNYIFISQIRSRLEDSIFFYKINFRLFRAIKDNETKEDFLNWFNIIGNKFADSFVIVGNFRNKLLTTDIALEYVFKNNEKEKEYGCVTILHRNNEKERIKKRILIGASFFVSQIIVNSDMLLEINISTPVFVTLSPVFSTKTWELFKSLGVKSTKDFENNIPSNDYQTMEHIKNIFYNINSNNMICSFEIIIHNKEKRLTYFKFLNKLITN